MSTQPNRNEAVSSHEVHGVGFDKTLTVSANIMSGLKTVRDLQRIGLRQINRLQEVITFVPPVVGGLIAFGVCVLTKNGVPLLIETPFIFSPVIGYQLANKQHDRLNNDCRVRADNVVLDEFIGIDGSWDRETVEKSVQLFNPNIRTTPEAQEERLKLYMELPSLIKRNPALAIMTITALTALEAGGLIKNQQILDVGIEYLAISLTNLRGTDQFYPLLLSAFNILLQRQESSIAAKKVIACNPLLKKAISGSRTIANQEMGQKVPESLLKWQQACSDYCTLS